jgi:HAMP domain-containing protein
MISIRSKITLIMAALVLISLTLVGILISIEFKKTVSAEVDSHLLQIATQKAKEYSLSFNRIQDEVDNIVQYSTATYEREKPMDLGLNANVLMPWNGTRFGSEETESSLQDEKRLLQRIITVIQGIVSKNPIATAGYIGTKTSMFACDSTTAIESLAQLDGYDNTKRSWYLQAKGAGRTVWTKPYVDAITKKLCISAVSPVFLENDSLVGVAGLDVLLETIQGDVLKLDIGYQSYAVLIDNEGNVLAGPGMTMENMNWHEVYKTTNLLKADNPGLTDIAMKMISGATGLGTYQANGDDKIVAYAPIPSIGASLGIVLSKKEVLKPVVRTQYIILVILAIVFLVTIVIGIVFSNTIIRPLKDLTAITDAMSKGHTNLNTLPEKSKDEIGQLVQSINRLITSLKLSLSYRKKLKDLTATTNVMSKGRTNLNTLPKKS